MYEDATEKGNIDAINNLGDCYNYGIGTEKNYRLEQCLKWLPRYLYHFWNQIPW
jgi:TPR repeat protein